MSFLASNLKALLALATLLALNGLLSFDARAGDPLDSRAIRFSDPKSDEVSTNLNQLASKKDNLKQFDEDVHKTFRSLFPMGSLDGEPATPLPVPNSSAIQSKRARELLEKRKNRNDWLNPDDMVSGPTLEEILKVPEYGLDGQEKKKQTALQRYYERLENKPAKASANTSVGDDEMFSSIGKAFGKTTVRQDPLGREDSKLPPELKNSAQALKRLFEEDQGEKVPDSTTGRSSFYSDIFGLGNPMPAQDQELEHKRVMDEFRTILDPSWRPASGLYSFQPAGDSFAPARPSLTPTAGSNLLAPTPRGSPDAALTPITPASVPLPPADATEEVFKQYRTTPAVPKVEAPKLAPPRPTFEFPKRPGI
jgi:hypothetical protein